MKFTGKIVIGLLLMVMLAACNRNYYSGAGKGGKGCGCPNTKGMSGY
jgi:predicted small secreted protein